MHLITKKIGFFLCCLILAFQTKAQYCIPTTDCTYGDGIVEFGVGGFYNTSSCEADMMVEGYGDFTALTGLELAQSTPASISLRSDFDAQQISIWIDTDNSMSFESDELVLIDEPVGADLVLAEIAVPNIPLGTYRLRVQAAYNESSSVDPCIVANFGETEDYVVTIVAPPACGFRGQKMVRQLLGI